MKKIFISFFIFVNLFVYGEWEPEFCLPFLPSSSFKKLQNENFMIFKNVVKNSLKKSWCSEEKIDLLMDLTILLEPKVCVEIGAFTGSSILPVAITLKLIKKGKIYAIDAWSNSIATRNLDDNDPNKEWWLNVNMNQAYKTFLNSIKAWGINSYCTPVHLASEDAVLQMKEIDFLHIDGDYTEIGSLNDVKLYLPKVKSGGFILFSGLFTQIKDSYPKLKAFSTLIENCEIICEIEKENTILLRKK